MSEEYRKILHRLWSDGLSEEEIADELHNEAELLEEHAKDCTFTAETKPESCDNM